MLLNQLQGAEKKKSFMNLAYQVATADGSLGLPEITMLNLFEEETGLKDWQYPKESLDESQVVAAFPDELSRKIIFSNLLALSASDEYENPSQSKLLDQLRDRLAISHEEAKECRDWLKMVKGSYLPHYYID